MTRPGLLVLVALLAVLTGCRGAADPVIEDEDLQASAAPVTEDADSGGDDADPGTDGDPEGAADEDGTTEELPGDDAAPSTEPRTFDEACAGRDDEAFIEVLTPVEDTTVGSPVVVTGCGNTFEANYLYRVETASGDLAAEGFGTMTCGNGCVGEFTFEVDDVTGEVVLVVFESSPEDGSAQHAVEVPITIE